MCFATRSATATRSAAALLLAAFTLAGCSLADLGPKHQVQIAVAPLSVTLAPSAQQGFAATVTGTSNPSVTWSATGGTIAGTGSAITYTAPAEPGTYEVRATSAAEPGKHAAAQVLVAYPPGAVIWTRQFGSVSEDEGLAVATGATGSIAVAGRTSADMAGGSSFPGGAYVRLYTAAGALVWADQFGGDAGAEAHGVAIDADGNVIVAGSVVGLLGSTYNGGLDAFVRKYSPSGDVVWTRQFGTPGSDIARAVAAAPDGSFILAGTTLGRLGGPNSGGADAYVRKYDPDGNPVWTRQFGTAGTDLSFGLAVAADESVIVVGYTTGDLAGAAAGQGDAFVSKYGRDGDVLWTRQFGTPGNDSAHAVAVDEAGNVFVAGTAEGALSGPGMGDLEAYLRKYDANGNIVWTRHIATDLPDEAWGLAVDAAGNAIVAGSTEGNLDAANPGGQDAFVRKFDPDGNMVWSEQFGTTSYDLVMAAAVDGAGNVILTGFTGGDLAAPNAGESDVFLRKLAP